MRDILSKLKLSLVSFLILSLVSQSLFASATTGGSLQCLSGLEVTSTTQKNLAPPATSAPTQSQALTFAKKAANKTEALSRLAWQKAKAEGRDIRDSNGRALLLTATTQKDVLMNRPWTKSTEDIFEAPGHIWFTSPIQSRIRGVSQAFGTEVEIHPLTFFYQKLIDQPTRATSRALTVRYQPSLFNHRVEGTEYRPSLYFHFTLAAVIIGVATSFLFKKMDEKGIKDHNDLRVTGAGLQSTQFFLENDFRAKDLNHNSKTFLELFDTEVEGQRELLTQTSRVHDAFDSFYDWIIKNENTLGSLTDIKVFADDLLGSHYTMGELTPIRLNPLRNDPGFFVPDNLVGKMVPDESVLKVARRLRDAMFEFEYAYDLVGLPRLSKAARNLPVKENIMQNLKNDPFTIELLGHFNNQLTKLREERNAAQSPEDKLTLNKKILAVKAKALYRIQENSYWKYKFDYWNYIGIRRKKAALDPKDQKYHFIEKELSLKDIQAETRTELGIPPL